MITFPNAKINLGLYIGKTLPNGYHEIVTVMVPVDWCDILEMVPSATGETSLIVTGHALPCPAEKNLVMKAYRIFCEAHADTPPMEIHLHKEIPDGAGMGGGSSDAAFTLRLLNDMTGNPFGQEQLAAMAAKVGSDCPFFIYNRPMLATGTGTTLTEIDLPTDLLDHLLIIKPQGSVSTAEAYADALSSCRTAGDLMSVLTASEGAAAWTASLGNDFTASVAPKVLDIDAAIDWLKANGATYAEMTGSGSAVFGIFPSDILSVDFSGMPAGARWRKCRLVKQ
jgi:4-(cytidine 5'-diphospho)-2-C-methyl-D-erythritol kinase